MFEAFEVNFAISFTLSWELRHQGEEAKLSKYNTDIEY